MGWVTKQTALRNRTGYYYQGREIATTKSTYYKHKMHVARGYKKVNMMWFPPETRIEVATLYAATKNVERVSELCEVPRHVINAWMNEPWWDNIVSQVRHQKNEELDALLTNVIHKSAETLIDRIENGEKHIDRRTKEEFRVPINASGAVRALEATFKQRQLLRGEATQIASTTSTDAKLKLLAEQFEKLATNNKTNTLEAEYVDVSGTREGEEEQGEAVGEGEVTSEGQTSESSEVTEEITFQAA